MAGMDDVTLTDKQWAAVEPYLPRFTARTGRPVADRRLMFEGMPYQFVTSCQWLRLPRERFGPHGTVFGHFNAWRKSGVFNRLADALRMRADEAGRIDWSLLCVDGTGIRAGACAASGRAAHCSSRPRNL